MIRPPIPGRAGSRDLLTVPIPQALTGPSARAGLLALGVSLRLGLVTLLRARHLALGHLLLARLGAAAEVRGERIARRHVLRRRCDHAGRAARLLVHRQS